MPTHPMQPALSMQREACSPSADETEKSTQREQRVSSVSLSSSSSAPWTCLPGRIRETRYAANRRRVAFARRRSQNPLTQDQLAVRLARPATPAVDRERALETVPAVRRLEDLSDVPDWIASMHQGERVTESQLNGMLEKYLSKFDRMVDLGWQHEVSETCRAVFAFETLPDLPYLLYPVRSENLDADWPTFPYNDTFFDPAKMLLNELYAPFLHHQLRDFHPLNIRCNYGTAIMPSIFGARYRLMETSKPWPLPVGGREAIRALVDRGIPDSRTGLGGRCFETAQYYRDILADYPNLLAAMSIYHPDVQGPFDVAHVLWGSDIFLALYDCPDLVHALLSLITETYKVWMEEWKAFVGEGNEFTTHWNFHIKGGIMLRDDSSVMLALKHYKEFVKPYDEALLKCFGGGIHYCGRGDQFVASMCQSENMYAIHSSQPHLNDVEAFVEAAVSSGLVVLGLPEKHVPVGLKTGFIVLREASS